MTITVNAPVTANAGTDQTVCGVIAVSLNANAVTVETGLVVQELLIQIELLLMQLILLLLLKLEQQ
jgi:hypothetical protein